MGVTGFAGGLVAAEVQGAGPAVWVFHSLLADRGSCVPLAGALSSRFTTILPDLPGFGGSAAAGPALEQVAARMGRAIEEGGAPAAIIANGYGSFVALSLALARPELVGRLVLAGTGAAFSAPGRKAFRRMAAGVRAGGLAAVADIAMRRLFSAAFQAGHQELMDERRRAFLRTDAEVFTGACAELAGLDLTEAVGGLAPPLLALAGEEDEATPPEMARDLVRRVPGGRFTPLPGLAHVPQLQDTAAFVAAVEPFLHEGAPAR